MTEQHVYDQQLDDDIRESSDSSSTDDEVANTLDLLQKRGKRKKKTGRRSMWPESMIDDLVDIVCSSSALTSIKKSFPLHTKEVVPKYVYMTSSRIKMY